jgi:hypothetical protein
MKGLLTGVWAALRDKQEMWSWRLGTSKSLKEEIVLVEPSRSQGLAAVASFWADLTIIRATVPKQEGAGKENLDLSSQGQTS